MSINVYNAATDTLTKVAGLYGSISDIYTVNLTASDSALYEKTIKVVVNGEEIDELTFSPSGLAKYTTSDAGIYTFAVTLGDITYSSDVDIQSETTVYDVTINYYPSGKTATPVNDIQTWLHCGQVFDKTYTSISEVLSDTTILNKLINDNNANDYLVRSTSWASSVSSNSTAMSYIGNNDYSADTLLTNATWCTSICGSSYFESVLNVKVPNMTSYTSPSGTVTDGGYRENNPGYYAFQSGKMWSPSDNNKTSNWVRYEFPYKVKIYKIYVTAALPERISSCSFRGYNPSTAWFNIETRLNNSFPKTIVKSNPPVGKLYEFNVNYVEVGTAPHITTIQYYGRRAS